MGTQLPVEIPGITDPMGLITGKEVGAVPPQPVACVNKNALNNNLKSFFPYAAFSKRDAKKTCLKEKKIVYQ